MKKNKHFMAPKPSTWVNYKDGENPPPKSGFYACGVRDISRNGQQYGSWRYEIWRYDKRRDCWETE